MSALPMDASPLEPNKVLLAAVLDYNPPALDTGGAIPDETEYVVVTRDNWRKIQKVIDKLDARLAFRAAGAVIHTIPKEQVLPPSRVFVRMEADG